MEIVRIWIKDRIIRGGVNYLVCEPILLSEQKRGTTPVTGGQLGSPLREVGICILIFPLGSPH